MTKIATGFSWIKKPGVYPDNETLKQYRLKNYIQPFMLMQPFYNLGYVKGMVKISIQWRKEGRAYNNEKKS